MYEKKLEFSDKAKEELDVFRAALTDIVDIAFECFTKKMIISLKMLSRLKR